MGVQFRATHPSMPEPEGSIVLQVAYARMRHVLMYVQAQRAEIAVDVYHSKDACDRGGVPLETRSYTVADTPESTTGGDLLSVLITNPACTDWTDRFAPAKLAPEGKSPIMAAYAVVKELDAEIGAGQDV